MTTLNKISDESCRKITSTNAITIIILGQESNNIICAFKSTQFLEVSWSIFCLFKTVLQGSTYSYAFWVYIPIYQSILTLHHSLQLRPIEVVEPKAIASVKIFEFFGVCVL